MKTLWKLLLVVIITIIWAAVSCGGNLFLMNIKYLHNQSDSWFYMLIVWGIEILVMFIFSIRLIFFRFDYLIWFINKWEKTWKFFLILLYTICGSSLLFIINVLLYENNIFNARKYHDEFFIGYVIETILVFIYFIWFIFFKRNPNQASEEITTLPSKQALELISTLSQVDISNIASITFIPTNWQGFSIKTPNIKKLAIYITDKLGKTTFGSEELRKAFDHVVANISSDLSKTDFNLIQGKISEFVRSGGEVKIERI